MAITFNAETVLWIVSVMPSARLRTSGTRSCAVRGRATIADGYCLGIDDQRTSTGG